MPALDSAPPAAGERAGAHPLRALDRLVEHGLLPRLARALGPAAGARRADRAVESITAWALLELSGRYRSTLLFRDYGGRWRGEVDRVDLVVPGAPARRVSREAVVYVGAVFTRPLQVVSASPGGLTITHRLLEALVRHLPRRGAVPWPSARLARARGPAPSPQARAGAFVPLADALDAAVGREIERRALGAVSMGRLRDDGPIWLDVEGQVARVPEELSVLDVVRLVTGPLEPGFERDPAVRERLLEALRSANREYAALRTLGLFPERFLGRYSIGQLRALAALRRRALEIHGAGERGEAATLRAFEAAWSSLAEEGGAPPGYDGFEAFACSEEGAVVMGRRAEIPVDEVHPEDAPGTATVVDFAGFSDFFASVRRLVARGALDHLDDLALRTLWEEDRALSRRAWRERLAADRQFAEALARDPELGALAASRRVGRFLDGLERKVRALELALPGGSRGDDAGEPAHQE